MALENEAAVVICRNHGAEAMKYEIRWYVKTVAYIGGVHDYSPWRLVKTRTTRWWWRVRLAQLMDTLASCAPQPCPPLGVVLTQVRARVLP